MATIHKKIPFINGGDIHVENDTHNAVRVVTGENAQTTQADYYFRYDGKLFVRTRTRATINDDWGNWSSWKELTEIVNTYPKRYQGKGLVINGTTIRGYGNITAILYGNGLAEINVDAKIETAGTGTSDFAWGVNKNLFASLFGSSFPDITVPQVAGINGFATFYDANGAVDDNLNGYGGGFTFSTAGSQFWLPGRVYNTSGNVGGWPASEFKVDYRIIGTMYGTFTV